MEDLVRKYQIDANIDEGEVDPATLDAAVELEAAEQIVILLRQSIENAAAQHAELINMPEADDVKKDIDEMRQTLEEAIEYMQGWQRLKFEQDAKKSKEAKQKEVSKLTSSKGSSGAVFNSVQGESGLHVSSVEPVQSEEAEDRPSPGSKVAGKRSSFALQVNRIYEMAISED
ncbi:hypothetical protein EDC01DRAFT_755843 [Geopyxis carbonaria]|nr:hypothetical protein EDC01DRAFT_755843 [Geopyxis carbonaria]